VSGVGEGLQNAAIFTIAGAYFAANRTLAFGVLNVAYGIGSFIGPRWGASLLADYGTWRAPLYIYGWIGVAGAVLMYVVLSRRFSEQQALTSAADVALEAHIPDTLVNKNTILLALASIFAGLASYGYLGLYPTYLRTQLNFTLTESAAAASMYGAGALAGLLCGYMADRMNQKLITIGSMLGVMAVGYCIFNVATTPLWQDILSLLEGCLASGFIYVNNYSLMQRSVRSTISGRASGLVVTCVYLPAAVSGYLFAELEQNFGWGNAALIQMTILLIIPVVAMLFFDMSRTSCPSVTRRPVSPALPGDRIAAAAAVPPSHGG
jgi:sugar phosphate permease